MAVASGLALLLLAILALIWGVRLRRNTGLPWAPIRYQDTGGQALAQPLFARRLGLVGKPDYLLEVRGRLVPVEVKPGRYAAQPYESDLLQLAAYCVLVEETSGTPPPYGLLRYAERTFLVDYTPQTRDDVLALLDEMRAALRERDCARSHNESRRCRGCGFFEQCDQALDP